jgi:large subunit ribosomal protein L18
MKRSKLQNRRRIHLRIRKKVNGTPQRPRLSVYRSNKAIYCQLVDDLSGQTLAAASSMEKNVATKGTKTEQAAEVGRLIASRVFDRGGYLYHGRVKALADGARENGLHL